MLCCFCWTVLFSRYYLWIVTVVLFGVIFYLGGKGKGGVVLDFFYFAVDNAYILE